MQAEIIFRLLFFLSFICMMTIRIYYQSKILRESSAMKIKEGPLSLIAGGIAALTAIIFGAEYLLSPGFFSFAYILPFPTWLRWLGAILLVGGIGLLWAAHHHLGLSFHSLVGVKDEHALVDTGPYKLIRHPIYLAYLANYLGGGLLAGNLVLTVVPVIMFGLLVLMRMGKEEAILIDQFGQRYLDYMQQTSRLLPDIRSLSRQGV
jgi:protein-S-isoprenylcysteine O-methyltransferase Ste14